MVEAQMAGAEQPFPDLREFQDPAGSTRRCSAAATGQTTQLFVLRDSQGRTWMLPYLDVGKARVYGEPGAVLVGRDLLDGFGITPESGWEDVMAGAGYPEAILAGVRLYLRKHPPISYDVETPAEAPAKAKKDKPGPVVPPTPTSPSL